MNRTNKGFSLIELMIAMVIVGILISIMLPSYRQYVIESRRSEGVAMLLNVLQQQERFYTEQLTYTSNLTQLGFTANPPSENGTYLIEAAQCGSARLNSCVLLTAVAQGDQAVDGNLTLNSRGERTPLDSWR